MLDHEFDPVHLRDLGNIVDGGNGCAREGHSAFRMETGWEGYRWGGGGCMAQRSVKMLEGDGGNGKDGAGEVWPIATREVLKLMAELPGFVKDLEMR